MFFTSFAIKTSNPPNGIGTIYQGSCQTVKNVDTWLHVILNGFATALIGASSYNMQCLASPSRTEVDQAHSKGVWLDIGVPSIRNLRHIARKRVLLWALLAVSSVPLHLLWNSAIFSTLQNNEYLIIVVSKDFINDLSPSCEWPSLDPNAPLAFSFVICDLYTAAHKVAGSSEGLTRLDSAECIRAYQNSVQSKWSNVLAVVDSALSNSSSAIATAYNAPSLIAATEGGTMQWNCDETMISSQGCYIESLGGSYSDVQGVVAIPCK